MTDKLPYIVPDLTTPENPPAGASGLYSKLGRLYSRDNGGTEYGPFGAAGVYKSTPSLIGILKGSAGGPDVSSWPTVGNSNFSPIPFPYPDVTPGTAQRLFVNVLANNFAVNPTVFELYVQGIASGVNLSVPAGATGMFSDLVHTVAVNPGNTVELRATCTAGGGAGNQIVATAAWNYTVP